MLGGADNPNGVLPSYITGSDTLSTGMLFTYSPDNPEGAAHQLQLFGGILTQVAHRTTTFRAAAVFRHGEVIQGTVCGYGSAAAGAARPGHPPDR